MKYKPMTKGTVKYVEASNVDPFFVPQPTYTVIRNGEFRCNVRADYQCGPKGLAVFPYRITVEGHVLDSLPETDNKANFLIEHYGLADRIEWTFGRGKWAASCEAFAGSLVTMVHDIMVPVLPPYTAAASRATRIHVSMKPGELAEIQLEWRAGQALPTLVAQRLSK